MCFFLFFSCYGRFGCKLYLCPWTVLFDSQCLITLMLCKVLYEKLTFDYVMFQMWMPNFGHQQLQPKLFCQICKAGFTDSTALSAHYATAHTAPPKKYSFFCRICEKGYNDKTTLAAHEFTMHGLGQAPRKCRFCEARFTNSKQLKKHVGLNHKKHA